MVVNVLSSASPASAISVHDHAVFQQVAQPSTPSLPDFGIGLQQPPHVEGRPPCESFDRFQTQGACHAANGIVVREGAASEPRRSTWGPSESNGVEPLWGDR
jgi:hypothetical protein